MADDGLFDCPQCNGPSTSPGLCDDCKAKADRLLEDLKKKDDNNGKKGKK